MPNKKKLMTAILVYKTKKVMKQVTTTAAHGLIEAMNRNPKLISITLKK